MRIAVISVHGCPCIPPGGTDAGGMNVYVHQTSTRIASSRRRIKIFSRHHLGAEQPVQRLGNGVELVHVPVGEPQLDKRRIPDFLDPFAQFVLQHLRDTEWKPDILTSHYWLSGIVANRLAPILNIPHVASFHTLAQLKTDSLAEANDADHPLRSESENRIARLADSVVAWTEHEAQFIADTFEVEKTRIAVIPPGVDTQLFHPGDTDSPARSKPYASDRKVILFVGRFDPIKAPDLAVQSFAAVRERGHDVVLHIIGSGSQEQVTRLRNLISELDLDEHVQMLGVQPYQAMPHRYLAADVVIAPSYHETFGMAALEAAACGIPVIAADTGGLAEIVQDDSTGYLVSRRDPQAYADKISRIIGTPALYSRTSKAARQRAERLSWNRSIQRLIRLYEHIIASRATITSDSPHRNPKLAKPQLIASSCTYQ